MGELKVLLTCHHRLDPDAGAPGATLALASALENSGCEVELYGFDQAFGPVGPESLGRQLRFPWRVTHFLRHRARDFDIVDATSGDVWLWATLRRPGAGRSQALITRAHGLEHVVAEAARRAVRDGDARLSWKYPIYHGGLRLWQVRRSLVLSDHCVLLSRVDQRYAEDRLGMPSERVTVMPNAVARHFHEAPDVREVTEGPLRLAFVGAWIRRKGVDVLASAAEELLARGIDFSLAVLGAGPPDAVRAGFSADAAERIEVIPRYANAELPRLLEGREILLLPSLSEGSSIALLEAMACGLAPVATAVGAAPEVIAPGLDGLLVEPGDRVAVADAIESLANDRPALAGMRRAAQGKARGYRWDAVARRTLRLYERVLKEVASSTARTKRGPTASQV